MNFRGPSAEAVQLSALDAEGRSILSVVTKRTYAIAGGECTPHPKQLALREEPRYADDRLTLEEDADLWPLKPLTDVVVRGHVYNHSAETNFMAGVAVGSTKKLVSVCGDRRCTMGADGRVIFSQPTVIEKLPLSYFLGFAAAFVMQRQVSQAEAELYLRCRSAHAIKFAVGQLTLTGSTGFTLSPGETTVEVWNASLGCWTQRTLTLKKGVKTILDLDELAALRRCDRHGSPPP